MKLEVQILANTRKFFSLCQNFKDTLYWETLDINVTGGRYTFLHSLKIIY